MRLIVARGAVDYTGRLTAHLPEALRLIVVKRLARPRPPAVT